MTVVVSSSLAVFSIKKKMYATVVVSSSNVYVTVVITSNIQ